MYPEKERNLADKLREVKGNVQPDEPAPAISPWVWYEKIGERYLNLFPVELEIDDESSSLSASIKCLHGDNETLVEATFPPIEPEEAKQPQVKVVMSCVWRESLGSRSIYALKATWYEDREETYMEHVVGQFIGRDEKTTNSLGLLRETVESLESLKGDLSS